VHEPLVANVTIRLNDAGRRLGIAADDHHRGLSSGIADDRLPGNEGSLAHRRLREAYA